MDPTGKILYFSDIRSRARIEVTMGHITACWPGWEWQHPGELEEDLMIWTVAGGKGRLSAGGQEYAAGLGDCFVLRMWEPIEATHEPRQPLLIYWNSFRFVADGGPVDLSGMDNRALPPVHRVVEDLPFLLSLQKRLIDPFLHGRGLNPGADTWMLALLAELRSQDERTRLSGLDLEQYECIQHLCAEILADLGREWTVPGLARRLHYSPDHFCRLFRRFTGLTPKDFLIQARIEGAKSLLRSSSASVTRIAEMLGYSDVYFFSRQFRARVGASPSQYRGGMGS